MAYQTVAISPEVHRKLKILAANEGKTTKEIVEKLIEDELSKKEK